MLKRLWYESPRLPVLILTARDALEHRIDVLTARSRYLVEVCVSSLRREIDKGRTPVIHTLRGVGYAIRPAEAGR